MKDKWLEQVEKWKTQNRQRRIRKGIAGALACVVVFCTAYALILPAVTMEQEQAETIIQEPEESRQETARETEDGGQSFEETKESDAVGTEDFEEEPLSPEEEETTAFMPTEETELMPETESAAETEEASETGTAAETETVPGIRETEIVEAETEETGTAETETEEAGTDETETEETETGETETEETETGETETEETETETEEAEVYELVAEGEDYTIRVAYGTEAELPEDVTLEVSEILPDTEEYYSYYKQALEALGNEAASDPRTLVFARFFDIRFQDGEQKMEPAAPVSVTITYDSVAEAEGPADFQAIHFGEEATELLDVEEKQGEEGEISLTHEQDSFSVVGNLLTVTGVKDSADSGPSVLPVDYYVHIDGEWTCVGFTKTGWYGDYESENPGWTDESRDRITVAQAASVLEEYGFASEPENTGTVWNAARQLAYQRKETDEDANVYSDTRSYEDGTADAKMLPLARNRNPASGYNVYFLPGNRSEWGGTSLDAVGLDGSRFYSVKVYDDNGVLLNAEVVRENESFTWDASASGVTSWLIAYGSGKTEVKSGSTIDIPAVTDTIRISPARGGEVEHSVTFKVCIDGEWQEVGSLPYYYSGTVGDGQRAYITSGMAAQFFGDYGYSATKDPGYQLGYSYNDIYEILYARDTGYCMDVRNGAIQNGSEVQLYQSNHSDAQVFRIWEAEEGYSYITPIQNSGLHVNVYGGGSGNGTKLAIHTATDDSSRWRLVDYEDGTTAFYSKNMPGSACIDLPGGNVTNGVQLQIWADAGNRYWKLDRQYRISNDIVTEQDSNGTYRIGLTPESNGDIVCYYLPGEMAARLKDATEEEAAEGNNGFWTLTVREDKHQIYTEAELNAMRQVVRDNSFVTVSVHNGEGIIWSCIGKTGESVPYNKVEEEGDSIFRIRMTQPTEIVATVVNPSFTVQYYGNIPRLADSGDAALTVIDTSGGKLPTNGGTMAKRSLYLEATDQYTDQNNGNPTRLYQVKTVNKLTELYTKEAFEYESSPGLRYFDKLRSSETYILKEIWQLKPGRDTASVEREDWDIYPYEEGKTSFTNEAGNAVNGVILLTDGSVLRLVYEPSTGDYHNDATFYDYDISSGQNPDGRWRTGITGINAEGNYGTSLNGQTSWQSGRDTLAFGNANSGTGMSGYNFDGGPLNKYNSRNKDYGGATFGLVTGLNEDGTIQYNDWIVAPKLFGVGTAQGKQAYPDSSLTFERVGDTYTLSAASRNGANGNNDRGDIREGLQYFFNPSPTTETTHNIFTNNFWMVDNASWIGKNDGLWGAYGNKGSFQGFQEGIYNSWSALATDFAPSDDGRAHNWFFGMNFSFSFSLTEDYIGPLEYEFFGDDDMWVFLDGRLICDIGGVHSSLGEYVNLWDYLEKGSSGTHTLSFYYTERGGQGSTCYMKFTLPTVSRDTTTTETGGLQISKKVAGMDEASAGDMEFAFQVDLLTDENGSPLEQTFVYESSNMDGSHILYGTVHNGGTITLRPGWTAKIEGIPTGTYYRVEELSTEGYKASVNGAEGRITTGTIADHTLQNADFVNTPYYELPSTGGNGILFYRLCGLALTAGALIYYRNRRRKGAASA